MWGLACSLAMTQCVEEVGYRGWCGCRLVRYVCSRLRMVVALTARVFDDTSLPVSQVNRRSTLSLDCACYPNKAVILILNRRRVLKHYSRQIHEDIVHLLFSVEPQFHQSFQVVRMVTTHWRH